MIPNKNGKVAAVNSAGFISLYLGTPYVLTKDWKADNNDENNNNDKNNYDNDSVDDDYEMTIMIIIINNNTNCEFISNKMSRGSRPLFSIHLIRVMMIMIIKIIMMIIKIMIVIIIKIIMMTVIMMNYDSTFSNRAVGTRFILICAR